MSGRDRFLMVLLALLWALCFPLIEVGLTAAPPLTFAALRAGLAGFALSLLVTASRRPRRGPGLALTTAIGISFTGLGFGGMFLAAGGLSPGLATVIANAQPLIAAGLGGFLLAEPVTPRLILGLGLGFAGVVAIALPTLSLQAGLPALAWIIAAATGTAVGNVLFKAFAGRSDALVLAGRQLLIGAVVLAVLAGWLERPWRVAWDGLFLASLAGLALAGTALTTLWWYRLLGRVPLNRLNTFTFLTPVFGLSLGVAFFGERLGLTEALGVVLILYAVRLVARPVLTPHPDTGINLDRSPSDAP